MTAASGKSRQFCSVCKDWLDMEIVPTGDGDEDDGVVWYRCPQCQGFLPKLKGAEEEAPPADEPASPGPPASSTAGKDEDLPWDSPAAMMEALAARETAEPAGAPDDDDDILVGTTEVGEPPATAPVEEPTAPAADEVPADLDAVAGAFTDDAGDADDGAGEDSDQDSPTDDAEPILEYASMLAAGDVSAAVPYRPWDSYEVGQCVNHLAWDDCGVVVAKESLPGGRKVIKCYFEDAGVIRLIEQAPR